MFSLSRKFLFSSFLRKQESSFFWIPGRVSLARNDNPTFPKLSNPRSPPAKPGVYLKAIKVYSPNLDEPLRVPFIMDISFEASSDKIIDFDTLSVKYLKLIPIDLTGKIKPYLNNNRLTVKDVKVPQGKHRLQLFIAYISGEKTTMEIVLNVEK